MLIFPHPLFLIYFQIIILFSSYTLLLNLCSFIRSYQIFIFFHPFFTYTEKIFDLTLMLTKLIGELTLFQKVNCPLICSIQVSKNQVFIVPQPQSERWAFEQQKHLEEFQQSFFLFLFFTSSQVLTSKHYLEIILGSRIQIIHLRAQSVLYKYFISSLGTPQPALFWIKLFNICLMISMRLSYQVDSQQFRVRIEFIIRVDRKHL